MGDSVTRRNEEAGGINIEPAGESGTDRGNGTSGKSSSATSTTASGGSGSGNGNGGSGSGGRTATETIKGKELPELALLTDEEKKQYSEADEKEQKRLLRNAKRRQRYHDQKAETGQTVKPRKVKQTAKEETKPSLDVTQLNLIVASLSSVVASRPNCEHWLLTEAEINSITVPLSKMLAESQMFASMGQYSNQIALCMACITVFMPRLIITVQKQKEVKKIARTGQRTDTTVSDSNIRNTGETQNSNKGTNSGNVKKSSSDGSNNADNVPFYGVPIC